MSRFLLLSILLAMPFLSYAQVGIGTTSPNAQLEIQSSNQATPIATDGILIPKVDVFPAGVNANQDAMLVYLITTVGSDTPGFYYYNHATTTWLPVGKGAIKIDDLIDGHTSDNGLTTYLGSEAGQSDVAIASENVGIGYQVLSVYNQFSAAQNVAIGNHALMNNNGGGENVALGFSSMVNSDYSNRNTAIGYYSMSHMLNGESNVAIGSFSMSGSTGGYDNIAIGSNNLRNLTNGFYNIALGAQALDNNSTGTNNIAIGRLTLQSNNGDYNIAIGNYAGQSANDSNKLYIENSMSGTPLIYGEFDNDLLRINGTLDINNAYQLPIADGAAGQALHTDGSGMITWQDSSGAEKIDDLNDGKSDNDGTNNGSSIFLGIGAGANDDASDNSNVGIGHTALNSNTEGFGNTAIGYNSMILNSLGNHNTAMGNQALEKNISNYNTAVGSFSSFNSSLGIGNTSIGYESLFENISGNSNIAIGLQALKNTLGTANTGVGTFSLLDNTTGEFNTGLGFNSLASNTIGHENVVIGSNALVSNTTGNYNVAIGSGAGGTSTTGQGNVFLGYRAGDGESGSNKLYIENSTSTPLIYGGVLIMIFLQINGTLDINGAYSFPTSAGFANQVLANNGSGQLIWQLFSDVDDDSINNLYDGKTDTNLTSLFLGAQAGQNDDDSSNYNIGIGSFSLFDNTSGEYNTAIGNRALTNNIDGNNNIAIGDGTLIANTTGSENTAIGVNALASNTTSSDNTAIGNNSLVSNTDGIYNTAVGSWSMNSTTTGFGNTALGSYAMSANQTGIGNVALGSEALFSNATGHSNIAIGINALYNSSAGDSNVAIGFEALYQNLNTGSNIAIGSQALRNNSGINNTVIGHSAGVNSGLGSYNVFVGNEAGSNETGSSKLYIESTNADANNALIYGEFDTNLLRVNGNLEISGETNLHRNVATGVALRVNGSEALWYNGTYFSWGFGSAANYFARNVGIGTSDPQELLHVDGIVRIGTETIEDTGFNRLSFDASLLPNVNNGTNLGATDFRWNTVYATNGTINTSDRREKKNIKNLNYGLTEVLQMQPVSFNWKNDKNPDLKLGLIAQELHEIIPEVVKSHTWEADEETGKLTKKELDRLGVYYSDLVPVLINAIKEQQKQIDDLKEKVNKLESSNKLSNNNK